MSPQDQLMQAVCSRDANIAIAGIDAALARGARFTQEGAEPLVCAVQAGGAPVVAHLLARGATMSEEFQNNSLLDPEKGEQRAYTALHAAAEAGDMECVRLLLGKDGALFVDVFDEFGRAPLSLAVENGHHAVASTLIKAGSGVNTRDEALMNDPPIKRAVEKGDVKMVRLLLEAGADPYLSGWMGQSADDVILHAGDAAAEIRALLQRKEKGA